MALGLVAAVFALIFVAELPGKSTMAVLVLAASSHPFAVFLGGSAAYLIHTAIAVAAGGLIGQLPHQAVELGASALFLALAVWLWREHLAPAGASGTRKASFGRSAAAAFGVVFAAQWGDPTQLATAALAAHHRDQPAAVFAGAAGGLIAVTALAVGLGHWSKGRLRRDLIQKAAAVLFAAAGLGLLIHALIG